jgi:class 3 adenylate cyclase
MPDRRIATVLMVDVVGSTHVAAELGDARYRELSSRFDRLVRDSLKRHGGREEDHAGDGFFATFPQPDRAIRCATSIAESVRSLGIEVRSGLHTGQTESLNGKTQGIAVVIGARVMSLAGAGEVLVTSTTKELATGAGFGFEDFSAHELKGVPGTWQVFAVTSIDGQERARPLPAAEAAERRAAIVPGTPRERPRRAVVVAAILGVAAAIAAIAIAAAAGGEPPPPRSAGPTPGSVVRIDLETNERTEIFVASPQPLGFVADAPEHGLAVGEGGVWVLRTWVLYHVDPLRSEVRSRSAFPASFETNVAAGLGSVWVVGDTGLFEIDPATDDRTLVEQRRLSSADVAIGAGAVWVSGPPDELLRIEGGEAPQPWRSTPVQIETFVVDHRSIWAVDPVTGAVNRLDPKTLRSMAMVPIDGGGDAVASGDQFVWVLSRGVGSVTMIDVAANIAVQTFQVGESPTALAAGLGAVWVGDQDGTIRRIDEATLKMTTIRVGAEVAGLAVDEDAEALWVDVA